MDNEQIKHLATSVGVNAELDGEAVRYYETFETEEEPHDTAWALLCQANESLATVGLRVIDSWSDNDSVGGVIVEVRDGGK